MYNLDQNVHQVVVLGVTVLDQDHTIPVGHLKLFQRQTQEVILIIEIIITTTHQHMSKAKATIKQVSLMNQVQFWDSIPSPSMQHQRRKIQMGAGVRVEAGVKASIAVHHPKAITHRCHLHNAEDHDLQLLAPHHTQNVVGVKVGDTAVNQPI